MTTVVAVAILEPATATTALLPGGVGGNGRAVLNAANLHASAGQGSVHKPSLTIMRNDKMEKSRISDPDSIRSVDPDPYSGSGSRSRRAKKDPQKLRNFICFEVQDVFFRELKASSVTYTSFLEA